MNLKEFDAKQFLLEKGEQVGLGVAATAMALMLIFSLFMPGKGFFSGSPKTMAKALKEETNRLETALRTSQPSPNDLPEPVKPRLIQIDTGKLLSYHYEVPSLFEPAIKESPNRRRPKIYNVEEAIVADARVLIDTYMFDADFKHVWVLRDPDRRQKQNGPGGNNPFKMMLAMGGGRGGRSPMPAGAPSRMSRMMQQNMSRFGNLNSNSLKERLQGPASRDIEYEPKLISVEDWNKEELTARQPLPLRVAVIGGSFPYREQLKEFQRKLRLPDINAVLEETFPEKEDKSFAFLGVRLQRVEVDADGNNVGDWTEIPVAETYRLWLKHTYIPFQPEDPQYEFVKIDGLMTPLLREFLGNKRVDPTMEMPGMLLLGFGSQASGGQAQAPDDGESPSKSNYPDVAAQLPKIQETLAKLRGAEAELSRIAKPKAKNDFSALDPFHLNAAAPAEEAKRPNGFDAQKEGQDLTVPDHALVRLVDVNLEPGKRYRYRLKIQMANPNHEREDVASPEYKMRKTLESDDWYEIKQTVGLPPELRYYVVDEKKAQRATSRDIKIMRLQSKIMGQKTSAQYRMWTARGPSADQVVFQFHRWLETVSLGGKDSDLVPVGQWAVADRVFVSRGEYVGRPVRIDLPIWKYMQNAYVLPAEPQPGVPRRFWSTGFKVDFGFDSSPRDTVLVDFQDGRTEEDNCRTEVLMLSPDGKLLARNDAKDTADEERQERRAKVLDRVEAVRAGKAVD